MITIRRTEESDIPALTHIVSRNYGIGYAEQFNREIAMSFSSYFFRPWFYTATDQFRAVGCAGYGPALIDFSAALFWVNVHPDHQRRGIGKMLVQQCIDDLKAHARIVILNTDIPEFYEKNWRFQVLTITDDPGGKVIMGLRLK